MHKQIKNKQNLNNCSDHEKTFYEHTKRSTIKLPRAKEL